MCPWKNNSLKPQILILLLSISAMFILNLLSTNNSQSILNSKKCIDISSNWNYLKTDVQSIKNKSYTNKKYTHNWTYTGTSSTIPSNSLNTVLVLKRHLPNLNIKQASLYMIIEDNNFEVYFDNQRVYAYGDIIKCTKDIGSSWHIVKLPDNFQTSTVTIIMRACNKNKYGVIRNIQIGPTDDHLKGIVKNGILDLILASLFIFTGLSALFIFCTVMKGNYRKASASMALLSISVGIWLFTLTGISDILIDSPKTVFYIYSYSLFLIPIFSCLFIYYVLNRKSRIMYILIILHLFILLSSILASFTNILLLSDITLWFHILLSITAITIITTVVITAKKGDGNSKILAIGIEFLSLFSIYDVLGGYFTLFKFNRNLVPWGMFIVIICMMSILYKHNKKIEEKLATYSQEIRLKETQLSEAMKFDMMKNQFLANISHEFRTPISIILGTLQLLILKLNNSSLEDKNNKLKINLKTIKQNCYRLVRLVNNLIDITKIDSGYLDIELGNYNIINIIEEITMSTASYIKSKNIKLLFDTDIEEKRLACDPEKIERIILNLLSNAVKFTKSGGEIKVNLHDKATHLLIVVSDTGIGIPKDKINIIFDRFKQVNKSLTRDHEGSGIGLSLVKSLVEMHHGEIEVISSVGKGTSFFIRLPYTLLINEPKHKIIKNSPVEQIDIEFSDIYN